MNGVLCNVVRIPGPPEMFACPHIQTGKWRDQVYVGHFQTGAWVDLTSHLTHSHLMAIEYTWTHVGEHFKQELEWCDSACVTEVICQLRFVKVFQCTHSSTDSCRCLEQQVYQEDTLCSSLTQRFSHCRILCIHICSKCRMKWLTSFGTSKNSLNG